MQALTAGGLVAGSGDGGGGGSAEGSASGEVGGLGGVRHGAGLKALKKHQDGKAIRNLSRVFAVTQGAEQQEESRRRCGEGMSDWPVKKGGRLYYIVPEVSLRLLKKGGGQQGLGCLLCLCPVPVLGLNLKLCERQDHTRHQPSGDHTAS